MFKAVVIDNVPYWDGGYMGNPALFPFHTESDSADTIVVQINPVERKGIPRSAHDIQNRLNEISFNSSLLKELRAIDFVARLLDEGKLDEDRYRRARIHIIENRAALNPLGASSKVNAEWAFLSHLRDLGRETAVAWLDLTITIWVKATPSICVQCFRASGQSIKDSTSRPGDGARRLEHSPEPGPARIHRPACQFLTPAFVGGDILRIG